MRRLARTVRILASDFWREDGEALEVLAIMCVVAGIWFQVVGWLVGHFLWSPPGPTFILGLVSTAVLAMAVLVPLTIYAIIRDSYRAIRYAWERSARLAPPSAERRDG